MYAWLTLCQQLGRYVDFLGVRVCGGKWGGCDKYGGKLLHRLMNQTWRLIY